MSSFFAISIGVFLALAALVAFGVAIPMVLVGLSAAIAAIAAFVAIGNR